MNLADGIGIAVEQNWKLFVSIDLPLLKKKKTKSKKRFWFG